LELYKIEHDALADLKNTLNFLMDLLELIQPQSTTSNTEVTSSEPISEISMEEAQDFIIQTNEFIREMEVNVTLIFIVFFLFFYCGEFLW